jgi:hypothetical protein
MVNETRAPALLHLRVARSLDSLVSACPLLEYREIDRLAYREMRFLKLRDYQRCAITSARDEAVVMPEWHHDGSLPKRQHGLHGRCIQGMH